MDEFRDIRRRKQLPPSPSAFLCTPYGMMHGFGAAAGFIPFSPLFGRHKTRFNHLLTTFKQKTVREQANSRQLHPKVLEQP